MNRFRALARSAPKSNPWSRGSTSTAARRRTCSAPGDAGDPDMKRRSPRRKRAAQARLDEHRGRPAARCCCRKDPNDERNVFLEVRAGTGGDESALFAGDLLRMYMRFAERQRWQIEMISRQPSDLGGYKEVIVAHRRRAARTPSSSSNPAATACSACRRPKRRAASTPRPAPSRSCPRPTRSTTSRSTRPTSASTCTARAAPAASTSTRPSPRCASRTCPRASWSSARTTARSTRTATRAGSPRGAHQGQADARAAGEGGSDAQEPDRLGDRCERIRTYNFPQGRVTDHRINLTLYKIDQIMDGDLDELVAALAAEHQAEQLAQLGETA